MQRQKQHHNCNSPDYQENPHFVQVPYKCGECKRTSTIFPSLWTFYLPKISLDECLKDQENLFSLNYLSMEATFPYIRIFLDQSWYVRVRKIVQVRKVCVRYVRMRLEPYSLEKKQRNIRSTANKIRYIFVFHGSFYVLTRASQSTLL